MLCRVGFVYLAEEEWNTERGVVTSVQGRLGAATVRRVGGRVRDVRRDEVEESRSSCADRVV